MRSRPSRADSCQAFVLLTSNHEHILLAKGRSPKPASASGPLRKVFGRCSRFEQLAAVPLATELASFNEGCCRTARIVRMNYQWVRGPAPGVRAGCPRLRGAAVLTGAPAAVKAPEEASYPKSISPT